MSEILKEFVFRFAIGKRYAVRVWVPAAETNPPFAEARQQIRRVIEKCKVGDLYPPATPAAVAASLVGQFEWNAIEVTDFEGDGVVWYNDWP